MSPKTGKVEKCTGNCLYGNTIIHGSSPAEVERKSEAVLAIQYHGTMSSGRRKRKQEISEADKARAEYGDFVVSFEMTFSPDVNQLLTTLRSHGFKPLLAGGAVRDAVMSKSNGEKVDFKDLDFEVYTDGTDANNVDMTTKLIDSASRVGHVDEVGKSFGVLKMTLSDKTEIDLSLPRRESKSGSGHTGFDVQPDITMSVEEASARRDFTLNSMLYDDKHQVIIDPHNGLEDLRNSRLRHTSEAFAEDPLRVLRSFQFASRFGFTVDNDTAQLSRHLFSEYDTISKERVQTEWDKWASKGVRPSSGLKVLSATGWDKGFSGLEKANTLRTQQSADRVAALSKQDSKLDPRVMVPATVTANILDNDDKNQERVRRGFVENTVVGVKNQRKIIALAESADTADIANITTSSDAKRASLDTRTSLRERFALHSALTGADGDDDTTDDNGGDRDRVQRIIIDAMTNLKRMLSTVTMFSC